jgi:hypothetical protein
MLIWLPEPETFLRRPEYMGIAYSSQPIIEVSRTFSMSRSCGRSTKDLELEGSGGIASSGGI